MGGPESGPRPGPDIADSAPNPSEQADRLLDELSALGERKRHKPKSRILAERIRETKRRLAEISSAFLDRAKSDEEFEHQVNATLDEVSRPKEPADPEGRPEDIDQFMGKLSEAMDEKEGRIHDVREEFMAVVISYDEIGELSSTNPAREKYHEQAESIAAQAIVEALKLLGKTVEQFSFDQYSSIVEPWLDTYNGSFESLESAKQVLLRAGHKLDTLKAELGG